MSDAAEGPQGPADQRYRPLPPAPVLPPPHAPDWRSAGLPPPPPTRPYAGLTPYPPQPGPPPWGWQPPPPRRRSPLGALLLGLVGLGAAGLFVLILIGAATDQGATGRTGADTSVDHSPARAEQPGSTPVDPSNAQQVVSDNTLYAQGGLPNGDCPARDLGSASRARQTVFYQSLMACLDNEWRSVVEGAGYAYQEPGLVVFDSPVDTPCGTASPEDGRTLAFYCPGDTVMYADVPQMRRFFDNIDVAYAIVIGHEFGHHIQQETGMLQAYDDLIYDNFSNRLELSRRVELQASCMGGLFLGAVADTFPMDATRLRQLQQVAGSFGDEPGGAASKRDHGSGASNRQWIFAGYSDNDTATCNTFTASSSNVD
ncbi:MAG: neutral zinc metallopeptidase [Nocardioidaceae bacterium]